MTPPAADGIHCITISTPFAVGPVNTYVIEGDPLTLVDTGPNSGTALDELEQGLASLGRTVEDIGLLVITHEHIDHFGLAAIIARRSGAEVAALAGLAPRLRRFADVQELIDRMGASLLLAHGIPEDIVRALRAVTAGFRAWGSDVQVTRDLEPDGLLEVGERSLRVLHRPGHSPSDTLFVEESRGVAIAGDHLIKHISSNPLIALPLGAEPSDDPRHARHGQRPQALVTYLASLQQTRALPLNVVLPGHGEPIDDHVALIDERLRMHDRRAEKIYDLISEEPRSAYGIARAMWGNVAVTQAYLTLSEVLGHVDLLLNDGRVVERYEGDAIRFEAVN